MDFLSNIQQVLHKKIKEEKIISQKELAEKMNVSPASVSKWLKGGFFDITKIPDLCNALNITPNELFGYKENNQNHLSIKLYNAFISHPQFQDSILKLLDIEKNKP